MKGSFSLIDYFILVSSTSHVMSGVPMTQCCCHESWQASHVLDWGYRKIKRGVDADSDLAGWMDDLGLITSMM